GVATPFFAMTFRIQWTFNDESRASRTAKKERLKGSSVPGVIAFKKSFAGSYSTISILLIRASTDAGVFKIDCTICVVLSPLLGVNSILLFLASAKNSTSLNVDVKAFRNASTRSRGTSGCTTYGLVICDGAFIARSDCLASSFLASVSAAGTRFSKG